MLLRPQLQLLDDIRGMIEFLDTTSTRQGPQLQPLISWRLLKILVKQT